MFSITDDGHTKHLKDVWKIWSQERGVTFISSDNEHFMAGTHLLGLCSPLLRDILCGVGSDQVFISVTASSRVVESALAVLSCEMSETVYNAEVSG